MKEQKAITQEEAIRRLKESRFTIQPYNYMNQALDMAISALEKQISMKPVFVHPLQFDNWIPCNERLPETFEPEAKAYLTTNEDGMIGVSYYHHMCGWSNGYESVFDVIAWQPLPEPYREEQEDGR